MENLKVNSTYLIKLGSCDSINSITILMSTEKAYYIRWNSGINSNDTWELKSKMTKIYSLIEDITEQMNKTISNNTQPTHRYTKDDLCPVCYGMGTVPDTNNTAGIVSCPLCQGNRFLTTIFKGKI